MSTDTSSDVFAGLDWAVHTHAVCVIDAAGAVRDRFEITHDRAGLAELMRRLARFGARVRIAIERPSGLIVDALVEAGHQVFPIHPTALNRPSGPALPASLPTSLRPSDWHSCIATRRPRRPLA
jgi:hypothetical protein